jgi:hypothetical protein
MNREAFSFLTSGAEKARHVLIFGFFALYLFPRLSRACAAWAIAKAPFHAVR